MPTAETGPSHWAGGVDSTWQGRAGPLTQAQGTKKDALPWRVWWGALGPGLPFTMARIHREGACRDQDLWPPPRVWTKLSDGC